MQIYKVEVDSAARLDVEELADFLFGNMSLEGAYKYLDTIGFEMQSLAVYAKCFSESRSLTIKQVHPHARRMVSHNKKWVYVFHIEGDTVVIDRILKAKMVTR